MLFLSSNIFFSHFSSLFHRHIFLNSHLVLILFSLGRVHSVNPCNFTADFFPWIFVFPREENSRSKKIHEKPHTQKNRSRNWFSVDFTFPWRMLTQPNNPTKAIHENLKSTEIHDPRSTGHRTHPKKSFFFKSEEDFF